MAAARKVLVVEDDPAIGQGFDRVLTRQGFKVVTVTSGADALKLLSAEDYDGVVADAGTPGVTTLRLADEVRAQRPWTAVVVVQKPVSDQAIEAGARELTGAPALAAVTETAPPTKSKGGIGGLIGGAAATGAAALAFPVVAIGSLVWLSMRAVGESERPSSMRQGALRIVLFFLSPFIALVYMGIMPMIGMSALMKLGAETDAQAGLPPRKGPFGMVHNILVGGRAWIAAGPGH